jgi:uncharacterized protein YndB with AHSA1/START domain
MNTLTFKASRHLDAPPDVVFDGWADPERLRRWFQCKRGIFRAAAVDELWFWEIEHKNRLWAHYCRWLRVERPRLLELTWVSPATRGEETRVLLELTPARGGTDIALTHSGVPDEDIARGHEEGWKRMLEIFAQSLTRG